MPADAPEQIVGLTKLDELAKLCDEVTAIEVEDVSQATLGAAMLIVEVKDKAANESVFFTFCTDKRTWVQRAMLREATETVDEFAPKDLEDADGD
jgi:hypothetical protein